MYVPVGVFSGITQGSENVPSVVMGVSSAAMIVSLLLVILISSLFESDCAVPLIIIVSSILTVTSYSPVSGILANSK